MHRHSLTLLLTIAGLITLSLPSRAADWDQFRGPNATGVSADSKNLPVNFSTTENVV